MIKRISKLLVLIVISQMAGGEWLMTRTHLVLYHQLRKNVIHRHASYDNSFHASLCKINTSGVPAAFNKETVEKNDLGIVDLNVLQAIAVVKSHCRSNCPAVNFISGNYGQFHRTYSTNYPSRAPPLC